MANSTKPRDRSPRYRFEPLESRFMLTGGLGNQFAELPASIATAGTPTTVQFTIDPSLFTRPRGNFMLGIDVSAQAGSTVQPQVVVVQNASGKTVSGLERSTYNPAVQAKLNGKTQASAIVIPINGPGKQTRTYTVEVTSLNGTTGPLEVGFYLPGDVDGDGTVSKADLKTLKADEGSVLGDTNYGIDADSNRNGKIDATDYKLAQKNLGVSSKVYPTFVADIVASPTIDPATRVATAAPIQVQGTATPGSLISLTSLNNTIAKVGAVADASGSFNLTGQLNTGSSTLTLTATDGFGQAFQETMLPITYKASGTTSQG